MKNDLQEKFDSYIEAYTKLTIDDKKKNYRKVEINDYKLHAYQ